MNTANDLSNTLNDASTTFNTATEAINEIKYPTIDTINSAKDLINGTSNNLDDLFAGANTFLSSTNNKLEDVKERVDECVDNVNNFINEQQEEISKAEKLLQIVFIALACLAVVGIIALIWNSIAKSRRENRQNEILEQISNNIENGNANYNTKIGRIPFMQ